MVPNSFKSIAKIRYEQLNSRSFCLIGCYGRNELIFSYNKYFIIIETDVNLRPGIYLQKLPSNNEEDSSGNSRFLLIHWSEDDCYESSASSHKKKIMTNLHRYKQNYFILNTAHQLCLMSDKDLECINWQMFEDEDDEGVYHEKLAMKFNPSEHNDSPQLHPLIVESTFSPMLITREMLPTSKTVTSGVEKFDSANKFREYFQKKLETKKYSLLIDRNKVTMAKLKIIIKDGLELPYLLTPYLADLTTFEEKKLVEENKLKEMFQDDMNVVKKMALMILKKTYIRLTYSDQEETISDETIKRINQTYAKMLAEIHEAINNISHTQWNDYKTRFIFAKNYAKDNSTLNSTVENDHSQLSADIANEQGLKNLPRSRIYF
ncbi:28793_t:CDS:2 [Dentiscutata erythropus]|uniref:28793_t:CDS:1 n=1 Tax=Dentiscutata erythropus TaxID=1348616 RepID=A0A9N9GRB8_9GLOM|nr:28793_t:CDS:2 [Dentiscutata erythropus]